jgi:large subunit ribosomal protein L29
MKASKLRDMSREDLLAEESALRERLFRLRFQAAAGQIESASKARAVRRDIARILTVLRETELAQGKQKQ